MLAVQTVGSFFVASPGVFFDRAWSWRTDRLTDPEGLRHPQEGQEESETISDVVIRLSGTKIAGLQRRREKEITTSDGRQLVVRIDQDKFAGAESCVQTAPSVLALDQSDLGGISKEARAQPLQETTCSVSLLRGKKARLRLYA